MRTLVLVVICACGRVGFDASGGTSIDGRTSDGPVDAKPIECEDLPGILFCDSFDGGTKLGAFEAAPPSFVRTDAEQVFRGSTSLHARTTRDTEPAWNIGTVLPGVASGQLHARWYLYYPSSNPNRTFASVHLISSSAPNFGVNVGATNGLMDVAVSENNDFHTSAISMPLDRWFCVQLVFTIAANGTVETWIDGTPAARLADVDTLPVGGISNVHAGLFTAVNGGDNDMWTDELAVGTQPIACL